MWVVGVFVRTKLSKCDTEEYHVGVFVRTKLSKCDTEEYREREAMASRMAQEIEKSASYQHHASLENGDGDDEELQFSAVIRTNDSNTADIASNSR